MKIAYSRELCVMLLEFTDEITNCFHINSIELVVFDQN